MQGRDGLKFGILMYSDHLQNWLDFDHGLLIFVILARFWLSETGQIWGSWIFFGTQGMNKQRVLTPGHQGWNDLHSLCRIGMEYYLLNDNNNDDNNNNNNNNNDNNNDNNDDNDNNNNNDDASGCFFTNVTFIAVAEIGIIGDFFFQKLS